jgi:hypothetical protein
MCDLNQYLNDDVISEIKSFIPNEAYIKELKQKNADKYSALIKEGIRPRKTKYEVGQIYYGGEEILYFYKHINEIDNVMKRSIEYQKIIRRTKCYVFYEYWFYDTFTKTHTKSERNQGKCWIENTSLWGEFCGNIRENYVNKISHFEYLIHHFNTIKLY